MRARGVGADGAGVASSPRRGNLEIPFSFELIYA